MTGRKFVASTRDFDTLTRNALKKVRIPNGAMLIAGEAAFKAFWDRDERFTVHDLVAAIYEEMVAAAIDGR